MHGSSAKLYSSDPLALNSSRIAARLPTAIDLDNAGDLTRQTNHQAVFEKTMGSLHVLCPQHLALEVGVEISSAADPDLPALAGFGTRFEQRKRYVVLHE